MSRIRCKNCGAESYADGDTGLVCITCFNEQAQRIKELERDRQAFIRFNTKYSILRTELEKRIKELEDKDKRLKLELAKLIDLLRLPSLFSMLSQLEKDSIEHSERALKGE